VAGDMVVLMVDVAVRMDDVMVRWQVTWTLTGWDTVVGHGGGWADMADEVATVRKGGKPEQ